MDLYLKLEIGTLDSSNTLLPVCSFYYHSLPLRMPPYVGDLASSFMYVWLSSSLFLFF